MKTKYVGKAFGREAKLNLKKMAKKDNLKTCESGKYLYAYKKK